MNPVISVVGPTGVGKSDLAIKLALEFGGEIIGADSRQLYHYMDIGTAKPTIAEMATVPHHLVDIIKPDESFSLAQYHEMAYQIIEDIQKRGKIPILVGGTGLYIWSVLANWKIPRVPPNLELRKTLNEQVERGETLELFKELITVDPEAAEKINPHNTRRIIRALEVYRTTGIPFSRLQRKEKPPFEYIIIGLTQERKKLYERIDRRVDQMIDAGLVKEVANLVKMGYHFNLSSMSAIGYKQIGMYLREEMNLATAIQQIKYETHRFVRQQYRWFRLTDDRIRWYDVDKNEVASITNWLHELLTIKDK